MCKSELIILCLTFATTLAYISGNLTRLCVSDHKEHYPILRLGDERGKSSLVIEVTEVEHLCRIQILAPAGYLLAINPLSSVELDSTKCPLSLFYKNKALHTARTDLCQNFKHVKVFPGHVTLKWTPSIDALNLSTPLSLLVTAVGQGQLCQRREMINCTSDISTLCVWFDLACDGYHNCPGTENDEDSVRCVNKPYIHIQDRKVPDVKSSLWVEFIKQSAMNVTAKQSDAKMWKSEQVRVLPRYGPWGYVMLGTLFCGTILLFYGVWECFHPAKRTHVQGPIVSHTVINIEPVAETTDNALSNEEPPSYEELDQPPTYSSLYQLDKSSSDISELT